LLKRCFHYVWGAARATLQAAIKSAFVLAAFLVFSIPVLLYLYGVHPELQRTFCTITGSQCEMEGRIFIDSPEIYTRERLVNDRFVQDAWLRNQLQVLQGAVFGPQTSNRKSSDLTVGLSGPQTLGVQPQPSSNGNAADQRPTLKSHPELDFKSRAAQRDIIRQLVIENQLDDRHDLDGNTLYMVKFDVAVLTNTDAIAAIVEADLHPDEAPTPLQKFDDHIPEYVDIPYSKNSIPDPKKTLYDRWLNDEERRLNDAAQKLFHRFSSNNVAPNIAEDFLFFLQSTSEWMPNHNIQLLAEEKYAVENSASAKLSKILSDQDLWVKVRPYVNLFVAQRSYEIEKGAFRSPIFLLTDFERGLCSSKESNGCRAFERSKTKRGSSGSNIGTQSEFGQIYDFRKDISRILEGETNLLMTSKGQDIPYVMTLSWTYDSRLPPVITVNEKTDSLMALRTDCQNPLFSYLHDTGLLGEFFRKFQGRQLEVYLKRPQQYFGTADASSEELYSNRLFNVNEVFHNLHGQEETIYLGNNLISEDTSIKHWDRHLFKLVRYIVNEIPQSDNLVVGTNGGSLITTGNSISPEIDVHDLPPLPAAVTNDCEMAASFLKIRTGFYNFAEGTQSQSQFSYATLPRNDHNLVVSQSDQAYQIEIKRLSQEISALQANSKFIDRQSNEAISGRSVLIGYGSESQISINVDRAELQERLLNSGIAQTEIDERLDIEINQASTIKVPKVGWAIFSGSGSRNSENRFGLEPTQKSLSALFSVPARWRQIKLGVNLGWMDAHGEVTFVDATGSVKPTVENTGTPKLPSMIETDRAQLENKNCDYTHCFIVSLPENYATLSEGAGLFGQILRKPKVSELDVPEEIEIRACRKANIEIPGDRLWRNTTVTLAGQIADKITVLPNMRGVVASFEPVEIMHRMPFDPATAVVPGEIAKLTIWTSEGKVEYPSKINILPPLSDEVNAGKCVSSLH
jgi:hypothetical protein